MSFSDYTGLKAEIADYLARDDLTANIVDFITLFESGYSRKILRAREQEATATLTPSSGTVSLPSDYLSSRRLTWTGSPRIELYYVHPSILQATYPTSPTDVPKIYTIEGGNILIRPVSNTALEFLYLQKTGAISTALNWLLTKWPDVYLKGSMVEAYLYLKDFDNASKWGVLYEAALQEIKSNTFNQAANPQIKVFGFTP